MPKNKKRGKNTKNKSVVSKRKLLLKEDNEFQLYGIILKLLGDGRVTLECSDQIQRLGIIRGSIKKRTRYHVNDVVLACKRDFQDDKVDIIHVYNHDEKKVLMQMGEIQGEKDDNSDDGIVFDDEETKDEDEINIDAI